MTILAAADDALKESSDILSTTQKKRGVKVKPKPILPSPLNLPTREKIFCQKYLNFARSLYSVLQWALPHPNAVSSDSWRLHLSEKHIDHAYILIFLSWWSSFRTLWNVAPFTAVKETTVYKKCKISLGTCFVFFFPPAPLRSLFEPHPAAQKLSNHLNERVKEQAVQVWKPASPVQTTQLSKGWATPDSDKIRGCWPM